MKKLNCTPAKARDFLSRAGVKPNSKFGQKLQQIIEEGAHLDDEQTVMLTDREQAQMLLPFVLSRLNDAPDDIISDLFRSDHDREVIQSWPEKPLSDEDYDDIVDSIDKFSDELRMFMLLDEEDAIEALSRASERQ